MDTTKSPLSTGIPNGAGAAAALAAGLASALLAILSIVADQFPKIRQAMIFYRPTGPLSGVTTCAIVLWLLLWTGLHLRWRNRTIPARMSAIAVVLLCLGVLVTFPPIAELF